MGGGMSKVLPGLYVGSFSDFTNVEQLKANKITHIISACDLDNSSHLSQKISRIVVDIDDRPSASISPHFPRCIEFIHKARAAGGAVLVHCVAGVSRSVTITAAYLLTVSDITWCDAISCIKAVRNVARPNFGFQQQLQEWCERGRWLMMELMKKWPSVPHNDREIINMLMEKKEEDIELGDEDIYPLAPHAYKQTGQSRTDTQSALGAGADSEATLTKGDKLRKGMRQFIHKKNNTDNTERSSETAVTCSPTIQSPPSCHSSHVSTSRLPPNMSPMAPSESYQYVGSTEQLQSAASSMDHSQSPG